MYELVGVAGTAILYFITIVVSLVIGVLSILIPIFVLQIKNRATIINNNVAKILVLLEQNIGEEEEPCFVDKNTT